MELDIEDRDELQEILILMYPETSEFKNRKPSPYTMEIFLQALQQSTFCNKLMTDLTVGLVTGPAGRLYRGPMKPVVKRILKEYVNIIKTNHLTLCFVKKFYDLNQNGPYKAVYSCN